MPTVNLSALAGAGQQFFDNNGNPLSGGKLYSYEAGTTTPQATYTSVSGATAHTNPIILDSAGRVATGEIWVTAGQNYKFVLKTSAEVTIATWDNVTGINGTGIATAAINVSFTGFKGQLGTVQDLADDDGSDWIGFDPSGASAVARSVQDKLRETVSVKDFGAVGDGVADDSAAFIAARAAANGQKIYAPAGTYKLNQVVTGSTDLILEGDGPSTILDFTGTVTGGSYGLEAIGTATQIENLGATANVGEYTVTFASAPSLAVGDVFIIYNPTNFSWSPWRSVYRAGEWCEVLGVSGSTVTLTNPLYDSYTAASVSVYKVAGPKVVLRNFDIQGTTILGLIKTTLCIEPLIENVKGALANNSIVYFDRCYKPTVINPEMYNKGDGGSDYGIVFGNSQHGKMIGGNVYSRRHAVAVGGTDAIGCVTVRDLRVIGATLKNDPDSGTQAADMHGNMEDCEYDDCTIYGGGLLAGKNNRYVDCKIYGDGTSGICLYAGEILGGRIGAQGCEFISYKNPILVGRGVIDFGGNSDALNANVLYPLTAYVENCKWYGRNLSSSSSFMRFRLDGATVTTNFVIDGLVVDIDAISSVLRSSVTSGTADSDFIVIDNLAGFPTATILHNSTAGAYHGFPHRCQKQTGSQSLTATSGTNVTSGTTVSFKYIYPRVPSAQAGGETVIAGNVAALPCLGTLTASTIAPRLISADATNWSSTITRTVSWSASIDEV